MNKTLQRLLMLAAVLGVAACQPYPVYYVQPPPPPLQPYFEPAPPQPPVKRVVKRRHHRRVHCKCIPAS